MTRKLVLPLAFVALASATWAYGCGDDGATVPPPPDPPRPTTVTVSPATAELTALGATAQFSAEVRDQNGQLMVVTVTWSSSNAAVATVNASGLAMAAANGTATITASAGTVMGSAAVRVAQQVSAVEVTPATGILLPDATLQLAAEAQDANGHAVAGSDVSWASADTAVAVVDANGLVTGISVGQVEVSATSSGTAGRAQLEVVEPAPTTLTVRPDTVVFDALGDTLLLTAEVHDQAGRPMPDEAVMWAASDTLVATVDATGLVKAEANGAATVTATSGALSTDAAVRITQVARRVTVAPLADTLILGDSLDLTAEAFDANGHQVADVAFAWSSGDASLAIVDPSGVVRGVGEGTAEIIAATESVRGVARITVFSPDRAPLVAFYDGTNGPQWIETDNWLTDQPLAQWHGVSTDAEGRVIRVNLTGRRDSQGNWTRYGLKGAIPPELGRLDRLERLFLYGNELSGSIPAALGELANLEQLDLSHNELSGPIPPEVGNLYKLKQLLLHTNALDHTIPPEMGNLGDLEGLSIHSNKLSGEISATLGDLSNLKSLNLRDNALTGSIPTALGGLTSLEHLYLYNNKLTGPIPAELGDLGKLTQLWLNDNSLTGPIPSQLGNLLELRGLALSDNELAGSIPPELGNLSRLESLWLSANALSGSIPVEFGGLTELGTLLLQGNELTGPIPTTLGDLKRLYHLDLHGNALMGGIPGELGGTSLGILDLRWNHLSGPIPAELGNLTGLQYLLLADNDLTGPIPVELGTLHELVFLLLGGNRLTGPVPAGLGELSALTHLRLEDNELQGPVPPDFVALSALQELNLTNNAQMAGVLPAGLTALTRLEVLLAGGTELCVPAEVDFETWLGRIYRRRIARCPEPSPSTAYLVQAVQSREFPVPLVAGEDALLRVFVTARQATGQGIPPMRARFFLNDEETHVEDIPGKRSPIPTRVDESRLGRSANVVIPGREIRPGLEMVIEVDPAGTLDPGLGVAKRIPEAGRFRVDVQVVPPLDLTLIPFLWREDPDSSIVDLVKGMATDPGHHELLHYTRTLLPISELRVRAHEPVLFPSNNGFELLRATRAIRVMEGGTGYYKGMMSGKVSGGVGGVAFKPGRSSFSKPLGLTMAHELGHNMSLSHAPCGGADGPDPAFPHADGSIGAWGYDFRERALVSPSTADLMGFCPPHEWISDFYFSNALRFRLSDYDHPGLADRVGPDGTLLLWGGADENGAPFLEPALVVDAPPVVPEAPGDYRIAGLKDDGAELFTLSFAMPEMADGGRRSAFAFALPIRSTWAETLASITLSGPGGSVVLDGASDRPVAFVRNPRSGQVRGFFRDVRAEDAFQVAAMAAPGTGPAQEVFFSRGIPDAAAWRR